LLPETFTVITNVFALQSQIPKNELHNTVLQAANSTHVYSYLSTSGFTLKQTTVSGGETENPKNFVIAETTPNPTTITIGIVVGIGVPMLVSAALAVVLHRRRRSRNHVNVVNR
jgi:hypothetical protein